MPYAYTPTSIRTIAAGDSPAPGETVSDTFPQSVLDALLGSEAARGTVNTTLRTQAEQALADLRTFRDLASPTNAQTLTAVKLLCRVAIALIRFKLDKLDGTD